MSFYVFDGLVQALMSIVGPRLNQYLAPSPEVQLILGETPQTFFHQLSRGQQILKTHLHEFACMNLHVSVAKELLLVM